MLFNSLAFAAFLPVVFLVYWFIVNRSLKIQNIFLMAASYFFYGCWDWRFVFLLAFSTFLDYYAGLKIQHSDSEKLRKTWLLIAVVVNLSFLGFFKYFNFFSESFATLINNFGLQAHPTTLAIILPVGISFYTFHGLSYVFDIYNRKIVPTDNFVNYSLFVSFFPLLVAGPIERATHLLPQVEKPRVFNYTRAVDGLRQILWGLFKKVVIADNCAEYANMVFNNSDDYSGGTLLLGALFFTFQIYGDFSGYSDIALGTARLFGFELLKNFSFPYFSRDIAEFWRRWHISLSSWFRDYLYIPLGGSRGGTWMKVRNTFIIFLVSGFWHGANWTFIVWGAINALFIMPSILMKTNRNNLDIVAQGRILPTIRELLAMAFTFTVTVFAWIFFRAESLSHAFSYIAGVFSKPFLPLEGGYKTLIFLIIPFMAIEWLGRESNYALEKFGFNWTKVPRWAFYSLLIFIIGMYMQTEETAFIYFQF
jgi:D-alanyl-lipoteichoic acid acyltransferase DltB (MBOAT superfamily)